MRPRLKTSDGQSPRSGRIAERFPTEEVQVAGAVFEEKSGSGKMLEDCK